MDKIFYYDGQALCTEMNIDREKKQVTIKNHTDNMVKRAFGIKEVVTWEDLELFLESRCFSRDRADKEVLLKNLGMDCYDPWGIVQKTKGKKEEDNQWLKMDIN